MADATGTEQASRLRNPILDAIVAVLNEGKDASLIQKALEQGRSELGELKAELHGTIEGLEAHVRQAVAPQIQQTEDALGVYEGGLDLMHEFLQTRVSQTLMRGGEWVRRGNIQVNEALYSLRNGALVAMGPTDIPDFNFLHRLYTKVKKGDAPRDANFKMGVERLHENAVMAQRQATALPPSADRDLVLATYRRHVEGLDMLVRFIQNGDEGLLEKGMEEVRKGFEAIREMIPAMHMKQRTQGPTKSPVANFALHLAMELAAGQVSDGAFKDALDQLKGSYEATRREFEATARSHTDSVLLTEEAHKVREALEEEGAAIDMFYRFFDVREGLMLGAASTRLKEAVDRLNESYKTFMEIAEREGKTLCFKCHHYNERDRRTCEKCGAMLIQQAETSVQSTFAVQVGADEGLPSPESEQQVPLYENIARIFDAVNKVTDGQITLEEFQAEIDWMESMVETHANAYTSRPVVKADTVPGEQREAFDELSAATEKAEQDFQEAVAQMREGVSQFRQYMEDGEKDHLVEGTRAVWVANGKLHEVQVAMAPLKDKAMSQA